MKKIKITVLAIGFLLNGTTLLNAQLTPDEAIINMGRGINLGNSLDAVPTETSWGNELIQEYYFDDYIDAGFKSVRIPITWKFHTAKTSPYTIDSTWLARVDTIVTWALERNLLVTINAHHEDGVKAVAEMSPAARADTLAKYDSIWSQVATHFKDRSDSLLFEILNEPQNMPLATLDSLNARILSIIRKTNPTRIVLFSGTSYTGAQDLMNAAIPDTNDPYLMAYYHSYDPWSFAGEANGTWGSASDISASENRFQQVSEWSETNGIPVTLNECGAVRDCDYNSRMIYYATFVEHSLIYNIPFYVWDDNGNFQTYIRNSREWNDAKDVILYTYPESPTRLKYEIEDTNVVLRWVNRTTENDSIILEKQEGGIFQTHSVLAPDADSVFLPDQEEDIFHYYRLKTTLNDTVMYSYPARFKIVLPDAIPNPQSSDIGMRVFPNPANEYITLRTEVLSPGCRLNIYSLNGVLKGSFLLDQSEITLDLSGYEKGIYYIRAEGNGFSSAAKFVLH